MALAQIQVRVAQYTPNDQYNCDETSLFCKLIPDKSLATMQLSSIGIKDIWCRPPCNLLLSNECASVKLVPIFSRFRPTLIGVDHVPLYILDPCWTMYHVRSQFITLLAHKSPPSLIGPPPGGGLTTMKSTISAVPLRIASYCHYISTFCVSCAPKKLYLILRASRRHTPHLALCRRRLWELVPPAPTAGRAICSVIMDFPINCGDVPRRDVAVEDDTVENPVRGFGLEPTHCRQSVGRV